MNLKRSSWLTTWTITLGAALAGCAGGGSPEPATPSAKGGAVQGQGYPAAPAAEAPAAYGYEHSGDAPSAAPLGDAQMQPSAPPPELARESGPSRDSAAGAPAPAATARAKPGTTTPSPKKSGAADERRSESEVAPDPADRPGLGTQWGETRSSRITTVPFSRADASAPFVTAGLFYNDEEGARAMSSSAGFQRTASGAFRVASGTVQLGLRDERGGFLTGFTAGGKNYVVGEAGRRYTIVLRNLTSARFEVVLSVDGLDVLDGKAASFSKRGYLIDPHGELEVDGFRQSTEAVAAFRFGSVRGSYANQKHGDSRNVGVIGLALFHERGTNPFDWTQDEVDRRHDANPFPGQFATPPGR